MKPIAKIIGWSNVPQNDVRYFIEEKAFNFMKESVWFDSWGKLNMPFELKPETRAVAYEVRMFVQESNKQK